jgi:hypothetical protein
MKKAIFKIDHRLVLCGYWRVQSRKPGEHRFALTMLQDAGHNFESDKWTRQQEIAGIEMRRRLNKGYTVVLEATINALKVS